MYDEINQIQRRITKIQDCIYSDAHTKKTGTSRPQNRDPSKLTHETLRSLNNSEGNYKSGPPAEDLITLDGSDDSSRPGGENFGTNVFANNPYANNDRPTYPYNPLMFNANNFTTPDNRKNRTNNATNTNLPPVYLREFDPYPPP